MTRTFAWHASYGLAPCRDEFTNFMFLEKAENEDVGKSNDAEWRLMKQVRCRP